MNYRIAIIQSTDDDIDDELEAVKRYLPANYSAAPVYRNATIAIIGIDTAGWTMDGYVIPRLASGNRFAKELFLESV